MGIGGFDQRMSLNLDLPDELIGIVLFQINRQAAVAGTATAPNGRVWIRWQRPAQTGLSGTA